MTSGDVLQLVTAFIWPVVVVLLTFVYRKPLSKLLDRLMSVEAPGFKGAFNAPAEEALVEAEAVKKETDSSGNDKGDPDTLALIEQTATQPWWAVHQAWRLCRWASEAAAGSQASSYYNTPDRVAYLEGEGVVSKDVTKLAVRLRSLYNDIKAEPELLTRDAASDFVEAAAQLVKALQSAPAPPQGDTPKSTS